MTRALVSTALAIACAGAGTAAAQPGATPTYSYRQRLLSDEERDLLARGEIGEGEHIGGGVIGTLFGFGIGHAVQGRYLERGWIFTVGEAVATGMVVKFIVECAHTTGDEECDDHGDWLAAGALLGIGLRIWQIADVWYAPAAHNDRIREIRWRSGVPPAALHLAPAPGGGTAGITLRF